MAPVRIRFVIDDPMSKEMSLLFFSNEAKMSRRMLNHSGSTSVIAGNKELVRFLRAIAMSVFMYSVSS